MERPDIKKILEEEFKGDPLYRMIQFHGLEDKIFTDRILELVPDVPYSTTEAGRIVDKADSTIRNYFRTELFEYIRPEKYGRAYRLKYDGVFKIHLIFILIDHAGKSTVDLLVELGMEPAVTLTNGKKLPQSSQRHDIGPVSQTREVDDEFKTKISMIIRSQDLKYELLKREKDLLDIDRQIDSCKSKMKEIETEERFKELEEKQQQLFSLTVKNTSGKQSFLDLFRKPKDNQELIDESKKINQQVENKYKKEITAKKETEETKLNELKIQRSEIEDKIKKLENQIKELVSNYAAAESNISLLK